MIDHTGVVVSDFERSKRFYTSALAPIGHQVILEFTAAVTGDTDGAGFGAPPKPDFWIIRGKPNDPPVHVAFRVESRALVDAFHRAALAAGGTPTARRRAAALPPELLRRLREGPGRAQHRGRLPRTSGLAHV